MANEYQYVSPPGEVLRDALNERGWEVEDLASRTGLDVSVVRGLLDGSERITRERARALGQALRTGANLWYQLGLAWRRWLRDPPNEAGRWMTDELRRALEAIEGPHICKKRSTVLLLAYATASGVPWSDVFQDERVCNQRIWYQKWQYDPAISAALEIAEREALAWRDGETARIEARMRDEFRRSIARGAVDGVEGMRATAREVRGRDGTDAAMKLAKMFVPDVADVAGDDGVGAVPVEVRNTDDIESRFIADVLRELGVGGGTGDAADAAARAGKSVDTAPTDD